MRSARFLSVFSLLCLCLVTFSQIAQYYWLLLPTVRANARSLNPTGKPRSDNPVAVTRMETTPCPRISFPMV
jgi:hypothetical protein